MRVMKYLSSAICTFCIAGAFASDECGCSDSAFDGFSIGIVGYYSSEKIEDDLGIYQMWNELGGKDVNDDATPALFHLKDGVEGNVNAYNEQIRKIFRSVIDGKVAENIVNVNDVTGELLQGEILYQKSGKEAPKFKHKSKKYSRKSNVGGVGVSVAYKWDCSDLVMVFGVEGNGGFSFKNKKTKHASREKAMVIENVTGELGLGAVLNEVYHKTITANFVDPVPGKNCDEVGYFEPATAEKKPVFRILYPDVVRYDETKAEIETKRSSFQPAAYFTAGFVFDKDVLVELGVGAAHVKAEQIISDKDIDWKKKVKCSKLTPSVKIQGSYVVAENVSLVAFGRYDFNVKKGPMKIKNNYTVGLGVSYRLGS